MPLDGTCASLELLNRLAKEDIPMGEKGSERAQRPSSPGQPTTSGNPFPLRPDVTPVLPDQRSGWRGESTSGGDKLEPKAKLPVTAQAGSPLFVPELSVNEPDGHGEGKSPSSASIIPANIAPSLPPLLSPRKAGIQLLPVAAATARQGAREEAMIATDDLDVLAAKIKQILDEQARRHGIDV